MENISREIYEKMDHACRQCSSDVLSLSGGLDSTIIAHHLREKKPKSIAVTVKEFDAKDLVFCQTAAQHFDLPLTILNVKISEILDAIKETILILRNFNDIEIRNNVVMFLALKWAKENGSTGIITGDGADELFAGYSFLINKSEKDLEKELQRIYSIMHFPTQKIGKHLGIKVESPFLDPKVIELALQIPAHLKVNEENGERFGKWILRKTYEDKIPQQIAWRNKSPMQDGAGTNHLTDLFENMIKDDEFFQKKKEIERDSGVILRTKESMHYFEIFKNLCGLHERHLEKSCPYCHHKTENSKFCRMCGAFPI